MTTLHYVKKARKAIKGTDIKKGDSYYWWQFAFHSKQVSKRYPRRSQYATTSEYLGTAYDIEDDIQAMKLEDVSEGCLDEFISRIEEIKDQAESSLDNIPDQLKEAPAGETLQQYIDAFDEFQSELEGVDLSNLSEDDYIEEATEEWNNLSNDEKKRIRKDWAGPRKNIKYEWIEEKCIELLDERRDEVLNEIQGISFNA
jgi:hypothetical protein